MELDVALIWMGEISIDLVVGMALQYGTSAWDFSLTWIPLLIPITCSHWARKHSCLQKGCMISLFLGKSGTQAEAARETCGVCAASGGLMGCGRDIKSRFSPLVLLHTVATTLESLLPVELSWYWNGESYRKPATCSINYWDIYSYSENFLSFLAHINAVISNNYWVILFTEPASLELMRSLS